jgi:drug/metabolite transporter (DMT)-like permease
VETTGGAGVGGEETARGTAISQGKKRAHRTLLGGVLVLAAASLWGTLALFARVLADAGISPIQMTSVRAAGAAVGLGLWMLRRPARLRIRPRDLPFFLAYGVIGLTLFHFLYFAALEHTSIAVAVALLYTAPAFVLLASRLLLGERIDSARLGALGLVLAGVFLVTGALRLLATGQATISGAALLFGLGSGLSYGLYTIFGKYALVRYDPYQTVFYTFVFGALVLAFIAPPWAPFLERPDAIVPLILLGIVPTIVPYLLYLAGLRHLHSSTASMLASIEPVVATLLGFILLGEVMGVDQLAGIALIIGAALVLATRARDGSAAPRDAAQPV